jgi:phosphoribosylanthranilate isomerase
VAPSVKICGIRMPETLLAMKGLPVDHIGFVFAKSKRQVSPEEAGQLIRLLRVEDFRQQGGFLAAGVFVNPSLEDLDRVMAEAPLDIVQLHGQETPLFCRQVKERFGVEIFKAATLPEAPGGGEGLMLPEETARILTETLAPYVPYADAFLLDTFDPVTGGGSGRTFPWETIPAIRDWARQVGRRLIIAGGLHGDNVGRLLAEYGPDGVDVSSGVETEGVKDPEKIRNFVERVKEA